MFFFRNEEETPRHLFFGCVVAIQILCSISEVVGLKCGDDFISIGKLWLSDKKYAAVNIISSAALWGLWKFSMLSEWELERCSGCVASYIKPSA
ncbi:hypothetical protein GQ55_6G228400 [Panicum hallii var. hallii]|uniref:Uncharacterized protein n=1 Tax=Panicum hallii var. hallii TaxID=1504633 RepID=A0A2T7D8L2_9POAL|nr:hypothetical protein GQ55_6G228400 [Panicum hallii var. hallii]